MFQGLRFFGIHFWDVQRTYFTIHSGKQAIRKLAWWNFMIFGESNVQYMYFNTLKTQVKIFIIFAQNGSFVFMGVYCRFLRRFPLCCKKQCFLPFCSHLKAFRHLVRSEKAPKCFRKFFNMFLEFKKMCYIFGQRP